LCVRLFSIDPAELRNNYSNLLFTMIAVSDFPAVMRDLLDYVKR